MGMKKASYRLKGLSPVLVHSTAGMSETGPTGVTSKADRVTGKDEAEQGAYRGSDGELVFPSLWVRSSIYGAASGRKIGKLTARRTLAGVILLDEWVTFLDPVEKTPIHEYEVDTRFVKIGTARIPRSRAKIPEWIAEFSVEFDEDLIDETAILGLLELAGKMIGIGDYRPSTGGGPFGRFSAELIG